MQGNDNLRKLIDHLKSKRGKDGPWFSLHSFADLAENKLVRHDTHVKAECCTSACAIGFGTEIFPSDIRLVYNGHTSQVCLQVNSVSGWISAGYSNPRVLDLFGISANGATWLFSEDYARCLDEQIDVMEDFVLNGIPEGWQELVDVDEDEDEWD